MVKKLIILDVPEIITIIGYSIEKNFKNLV